MATAEEVLQTMAEVPESAPVCVIDPETRTIIVPPEYQLFGVENDKRTERLYFQCPKIVGDNQDLSRDYQLFINYQNANGDPDAYHIEDMEVDGDNMTFSWLLEENVTKYRGNIQFAFGAIIPGDEAEDPDKNRWNTTINTDCTCLVGLKCTRQVAESNPDALVQIWAAIDELKAGGGSGTGTGGTTNYNNLSNKPRLNGVTLEGNKTLDQVGVLAKNQGASNSGKYLSVGSDGNVVPADAPSGGGSGSGTPGKDGREIQIQNNGTAIQWRYAGDGSWTDLVQLSEITGSKGDPGETPNIQIGTVQTLEPGQQATASMTGTPENPLLNLGIPKGATGGGEGGGGITEETDPTVPAWAKEPTKPTYTAVEVGADASGTAEAKVSVHNTAADAHSDIRLLVQELTTRLNALADSDDDTLDQMSEIVAYIKSNKSLIDAITTQKVSVTDIIDNLTTNVANKPLSAAQGVALKALIDGITIPEALPNPQKLIFTGAVTAEYDGSTQQTINIPTGGGSDSYTLPIMSDTQLGGGKAVEKTDEDVPVAVDPLTGQLFVPTYPESTGGSADIPRQEMKNTDTTITLDPNKLYVFPEMTSLTVTLAEPSNTNVANEYHFFFTSGATATTLTLNDVLSDAYSIEANMKYEVSILEGVAYIKGVAAGAA